VGALRGWMGMRVWARLAKIGHGARSALLESPGRTVPSPKNHEWFVIQTPLDREARTASPVPGPQVDQGLTYTYTKVCKSARGFLRFRRYFFTVKDAFQSRKRWQFRKHLSDWR
jgi:hypothetical protein